MTNLREEFKKEFLNPDNEEYIELISELWTNKNQSEIDRAVREERGRIVDRIQNEVMEQRDMSQYTNGVCNYTNGEIRDSNVKDSTCREIISLIGPAVDE